MAIHSSTRRLKDGRDISVFKREVVSSVALPASLAILGSQPQQPRHDFQDGRKCLGDIATTFQHALRQLSLMSPLYSVQIPQIRADKERRSTGPCRTGGTFDENTVMVRPSSGSGASVLPGSLRRRLVFSVTVVSWYAMSDTAACVYRCFAHALT